LDWCAARGLQLTTVRPFHVAAWIEDFPGSKPTIKQKLAAVRMLYDFLVVRQITPSNPAHSVRGPKYVVKKGKTPVWSREDAKTLLGTAVTGRALNRYNAWTAIRKRAKAAGFLTPVGCHTWRATGITIYLENDGRLEHAQQMAGHESPRTTKLYDRTKDEITLSEVEQLPLTVINSLHPRFSSKLALGSRCLHEGLP
jgi:site-specific recombinase XerD